MIVGEQSCIIPGGGRLKYAVKYAIKTPYFGLLLYGTAKLRLTKKPIYNDYKLQFLLLECSIRNPSENPGITKNNGYRHVNDHNDQHNKGKGKMGHMPVLE
jgi:hypothetical protein